MKVLLMFVFITSACFSQHKIEKKSLFNEDVVSYLISDARFEFSRLDSLGNIIDSTGSLNFLIIFQDSLGQKIFDKRIIVKNNDFKALGIKEKGIYKYIEKLFNIKDR